MAKAKVAYLAVDGKTKEGKPVRQPGADNARGLYAARAAEFVGKPVAELEASCKANPPSTPDTGKYENKQEPFGGWLRYLTSDSHLYKVVMK